MDMDLLEQRVERAVSEEMARGRTIERVRALIRQADPGVVEERKWSRRAQRPMS
jgi:hypothetical protein